MDYRQYLIDNWNMIAKANAEDYPNGVDSTGYRAEKHIAYLGDYDPSHMLNLYYPDTFKGDHKIPAVIYIHGGGWMYGNADISERILVLSVTRATMKNAENNTSACPNKRISSILS